MHHELLAIYGPHLLCVSLLLRTLHRGPWKLTPVLPHSMLDRVERFLHPEGIVGTVDFYVSGRSSENQTVENAGDTKRYCNLLVRWFWLHWFEWDHVCLHPSRRNCEFRLAHACRFLA